MTESRWQRVEAIYHAARALDGDARASLLRESCGGDAALLAEVSSLLSYDTAACDELERSALEHAARAVADDEALWHPGETIAGYRIVSHLGSGGMGDVYVARDLTLDREIALKLFPIAVAADASYLRRFEEEARTASALAHPGIVTIYAAGEDKGVGFIAMELVRGQTLRARLSAGPLPAGELLDLAVQLAEAVHAAHEAGVVHRDLKPENIMVTGDGRLKVLDFGIARRESGADRHGVLAGTVAYMAPEQGRGAAADSRSDQYAVGAVLHEMLTGRKWIDRGAGGVDPGDKPRRALAAIAARAASDEPGLRFESMRDLADALRALRDRASGESRLISRRRAFRLGAGTIAAIAIGAAGWTWLRGRPGPMSLAILPFDNVDHDPGLAYLSEGLTSSLIDVLSSRALRVLAYSTVSHTGNAADPAAAGRALNVRAVLSGTIARGAGGLHVTAELVDARSGARLWGHTYDRPTSDVAFIQAAIARAIVGEGMSIPLDGEDRARLLRRLSVRPDAYERYLMGVRLAREDNEDGYLRAQAALAEAVRLDPNFAEAHAALASTYSILAVDGYVPPAGAWQQATRSFRRALALDPALPNAHAEYATWLLYSQWDARAAEREWETALRGPSEDTQPDYLLSYALEAWATRHVDLAVSLARRARALDPFSATFAIREADFLLSAGRDDAAEAIYDEVIARQPSDAEARLGLAEVLGRRGRYDAALAAMREGFRNDGRADLVRASLDARGRDGLDRVRRAAAQADLDALRARAASGAYVSALEIARVHARLGDTPQALACFPQALAERSPALVFLAVDPAWDSIRAEPAFQAAVRQVHIDR